MLGGGREGWLLSPTGVLEKWPYVAFPLDLEEVLSSALSEHEGFPWWAEAEGAPKASLQDQGAGFMVSTQEPLPSGAGALSGLGHFICLHRAFP